MSLQDREYRRAFIAENIRTVIAQQIRSLRERRDWSQGTLGEEAGTTQSVIARLEDPDYGRMSVSTLLKLADAFDVALVVKFVSLSKFRAEYRDLSPDGLAALSFEEEQAAAEAAARDRAAERPRLYRFPDIDAAYQSAAGITDSTRAEGLAQEETWK